MVGGCLRRRPWATRAPPPPPRTVRLVETTLARPLARRIACAALKTTPIDPPPPPRRVATPRLALVDSVLVSPTLSFGFSLSLVRPRAHPLSARTFARKIHPDTRWISDDYRSLAAPTPPAGWLSPFSSARLFLGARCLLPARF